MQRIVQDRICIAVSDRIGSDPHRRVCIHLIVADRIGSDRPRRATPACRQALLDHGVYQELSPELRRNYAALWLAVLSGSRSAIREAREALQSATVYPTPFERGKLCEAGTNRASQSVRSLFHEQVSPDPTR